MTDTKMKSVPKVRFEGFTDDWEERKLTEIVNRVNKSSNSDVLPKVEFEDIVSSRSLYRSDYSNKRQIIPAPICRTTEII